jgi:hypothetical protein
MTPSEFRRIELAHQVSTAVFFGGFVALVMLPFIEHGRIVAALIGG